MDEHGDGSRVPNCPLLRGINLGNALDVARGHVPLLHLDERHLDEVATAGFDFVRIPVRWSAHASRSASYEIDVAFFEVVDRTIEAALSRNLAVIVNVHHYDELQRLPRRHTRRFVTIWKQIAARYSDVGERLYFELLNEAHGTLTATIWNHLLRKGLAAIRDLTPERVVIVGPVSMNGVVALPELELPDDDHLVATIHYYAPFQFTHQGAPWVRDASRWVGTVWGDDADRRAVSADLAQAADWARIHQRPLLVGEFGVYEKADLSSRVRWTAFVRSEAERLGLGWCYWDFATDFGAFDLSQHAWRQPLRTALLDA